MVARPGSREFVLFALPWFSEYRSEAEVTLKTTPMFMGLRRSHVDVVFVQSISAGLMLHLDPESRQSGRQVRLDPGVRGEAFAASQLAQWM